MKYVCEKCGMSFDSITDCQTHEENNHKTLHYVYIDFTDFEFIVNDVSLSHSGNFSLYKIYQRTNAASFYIFVTPGDEERGKQLLLDAFQNTLDYWREQGRMFAKFKKKLEAKK